jgi:hypothetical protein
MDEIKFDGVVTAGIGKYSKLVIPGRSELLNCPADWPDTMHPGSLNVRVTHYPDEFSKWGFDNNVRQLDTAHFRATFEIPRDQILNNMLFPSRDMPRGGDAQVWRANLSALDGSVGVSCWVLRRFGSGLRDQLEIVAGEYLRAKGFTDDLPVRVCLIGTWV